MAEGWAARFRGRRPRLGEVLDGHDNNFDLLRLLAASSVIYGHSFFEAPDDPAPDLVRRLFGGAEYAGSVAVYAFFLISGLLITASMERHRSAPAFVVLRFARIWPGFAVCAAVLLFFVVPLASGLPLGDPAWSKAAAACWRRDALFPLRDICGALPGAFPATPVPDAFGFSWWTLTAEVHCYALVLVLGVVLRSRFSGTAAERLRFALATLALGIGFVALTRRPPGDDAPFHAELVVMGGYSSYPVLFFFAGMLLYAFRRSVPVDGPAALAVALVAAASATAFAWPSAGWGAGPLAYPALAYGVLALAAARPLRRLRPRRDLSYGVYVYGAAVQQAVATVMPGRSALANFAVALPAALAIAYASARLVEGPAIALGRSVARRLARPNLRPAPGVDACANGRTR